MAIYAALIVAAKRINKNAFSFYLYWHNLPRFVALLELSLNQSTLISYFNRVQGIKRPKNKPFVPFIDIGRDLKSELAKLKL